jgi:hypothetical protein
VHCLLASADVVVVCAVGLVASHRRRAEAEEDCNSTVRAAASYAGGTWAYRWFVHSEFLQAFLKNELLPWSVVNAQFGGYLRTIDVLGAHGEERWTVLRNRVVEHVRLQPVSLMHLCSVSIPFRLSLPFSAPFDLSFPLSVSFRPLVSASFDLSPLVSGSFDIPAHPHLVVCVRGCSHG